MRLSDNCHLSLRTGLCQHSSIMLSALIAVHTAMNTPIAPATDEKSMDFWIGTWEVNSYQTKADGTILETLKMGTNTISKIKGGKVIHEDFKIPGFNGESWSVFNPQDKTWRQTWVDDSGGYLTLDGGQVGEEFVLNLSYPNKNQRMRFTKITKESFTWIWESKQEEKWSTAWRIEYKRIKK